MLSDDLRMAGPGQVVLSSSTIRVLSVPSTAAASLYVGRAVPWLLAKVWPQLAETTVITVISQLSDNNQPTFSQSR